MINSPCVRDLRHLNRSTIDIDTLPQHAAQDDKGKKGLPASLRRRRRCNSTALSTAARSRDTIALDAALKRNDPNWDPTE